MRAILFDLDGVLVDASEIHYNALNRALKETSFFTIDRAEHDLKFNGLPTRNKLAQLVKQKRVLENQMEKIYNLKQVYTEEEIAKVNLFNKEKLHMVNKLWLKGFKQGIVTNCSGKTAKLMLSKAIGEYNKFFHTVVTNDQVRFSKPHPEGYIKAMVNVREFPEECLIFEDNENGIVAAHATGANVVKVDDVNEVNLEFVERYL